MKGLMNGGLTREVVEWYLWECKNKQGRPGEWWTDKIEKKETLDEHCWSKIYMNSSKDGKSSLIMMMT